MTARRVTKRADAHYAHVQNEPATAWIIDHNLGKIPSVTVIDSGGRLVMGEVVHNSIVQAVVSFTEVFAGQAHCN